MANSLRLSLGGQAAGTAHFCEMFDKFFDCLNVSHLDEGKKKRNLFKSPYRSSRDFRLKVYTCIYTGGCNKMYNHGCVYK